MDARPAAMLVSSSGTSTGVLSLKLSWPLDTASAVTQLSDNCDIMGTWGSISLYMGSGLDAHMSPHDLKTTNKKSNTRIGCIVEHPLDPIPGLDVLSHDTCAWRLCIILPVSQHGGCGYSMQCSSTCTGHLDTLGACLCCKLRPEFCAMPSPRNCHKLPELHRIGPRDERM